MEFIAYHSSPYVITDFNDEDAISSGPQSSTRIDGLFFSNTPQKSWGSNLYKVKITSKYPIIFDMNTSRFDSLSVQEAFDALLRGDVAYIQEDMVENDVVAEEDAEDLVYEWSKYADLIVLNNAVYAGHTIEYIVPNSYYNGNRANITIEEVYLEKQAVTQEEVAQTHDWSLNDIITDKFSYGELLDMIQAKEWELLQEELSTIRGAYPTYEIEHNMNPLAIFSDLFNLVGKPARVLAKEYETNVWKMQKDSVAQGIYFQQHNNNEPFNLEVKNYPSTLAPILRPAKLVPVLDTEMDNSSAGQFGSIWPSNVFSTNPNQRLFRKKKQLLYGPGESVFKTQHIDRIIGYSMKDALTI